MVLAGMNAVTASLCRHSDTSALVVASTASRMRSVLIPMYRMVVLTLEWPSSWDTSSMSQPVR